MYSRYNLKRRVATLPPISSEVFTEKVLLARATTTAEAERAGFQKDCGVCHKTFFSENSYQNHLGSQKHKAKVAALLRKGKNGVSADDASSMISSTFSLGDPVQSNASEVDSDAEEFGQIVEGMKKADISEKEGSSPVKDAAEHPAAEETPEEQATTPTKASGAATDLPLSSCLFCNHESHDVPTNVIHMEKTHGMFIPERQYLVKLEGLLGSLQQRIQEFHECLFCGKVKSNAFAVQTHMRDTAHCRIPYTTEDEQLEIGEFYDFRSTYSDDDDMEDDSDDDDDDESTQNGGVKLGNKRAAVTTNDDGEEIEEGGDEGWETDSSASSLDSADLTAVPAENHYHQYDRLETHPHHTSHDPRPHRQADGWHSHSHKPIRAVFHDEYELHLPSGKSVGHRSLNRYFRQNLRERPFLEGHQQRLAIENAEDSDAMDVDDEDGSDDQRIVHRPMRDQKRQLVGRAHGSSGMVGVSDMKKKEVHKAELKGRKAETVRHKKNQWQINKEGNHQKYFHYSIL